MKKNRIFSLLSALVLLMAGACSDDTLQPGKGRDHLNTDETGGVYMTVDFKIPDGSSGTRSQTDGNDGQSTDGVEIGSEAENYVTSALIVLASKEAKTVKVDDNTSITLDQYGYIVAGEVRSNHITNQSDGDNKLFKAAAKLNKENLNKFYDMYATESTDGTITYNIPEVYVFVFANPTKELTDLFADADLEDGIGFGSAGWIDKTCDVIQTSNATANKNIGIWGANSFLMNNKKLALRLLPSKLLDWENYNSYENAFHLSEKNEDINQTIGVDNGDAASRGPISVERSVARFDYKDGSPTNDSRYNVLYMIGPNGNIDDKTYPIVGVEIQKMCLVNMSNKFYYLPRVSEDGLLAGSTLCGRERAWTSQADGKYTGGNYVVGPYADVFSDAKSITDNFSTYFNFSFFDDKGKYNNPDLNSDRWDVVKVSTVLGGPDDNYKENGHKPGDYKVWRYVTENVIPAGNDNQINGISTGVVFKAKMVGALKNNVTYTEESWNEGYLQNLANCLDGKTFTYNGKDHTLKGNPNEDPILYYFNGNLYMGWRHIRQAAIQASVTVNVAGEFEINRSTSLYRAVFGDGPIPPKSVYDTDVNGNPKEANTVYINSDGKSVDLIDPQWSESAEVQALYEQSPNYFWTVWAENGKEIGNDATGDNAPKSLQNMRENVTGAGITIFQSSIDKDFATADYNGAGYYCYYYYWNRHNDNLKNGSMGPMEFDVVRNNVYKLSIDKISRLGHPRIPENDPNNPTPETPDESDDIYLDVKIDIVPWVVRVNKIIF